MRARTPHTDTSRGFGLVELLVAVAIFISIIGAIGVIFNGSLRSLRQAEQNQEVYEMIRGAMQVMERDLANAFVAREYGDVYQFYGTPIGFTFVGLVKIHPGDQPNLARVTYVLRRDTLKDSRRSETSDLENTASIPAFQVDGLDNDGDGTIDESDEGYRMSIFETDGLDNDGDGVTDEPGEGSDVPTFSLVRYIERGVDNLEAYPVAWDDDTIITDDPDIVALPNTLEDLIGYPDDLATTMTYSNFVQNAIDTGLCRSDDLRCLDEVVKAGRRQIWIAMLAGQRTTWFDPGLALAVDLPDFLGDSSDPEDYVLIENIAVDNISATFAAMEASASARSDISSIQNPRGEFEAVSYNGQFFQYSEWVPGTVTDFGPPIEVRSVSRPNRMSFWMDWRNINLSNNGLDDNNSDACCDNVDNDGANGMDDADPNEANFLIDCDLDELIAALDNDWLDNDLDGIVDCDIEELPYPNTPGPPPTDWIFAPGPGPGSPLSPSLPQQMNVRFRIFAEAPTVGAPDFERNFNFQIDIPSAAARVSTTE